MTRYAHHSGGLQTAGRAVGLAMALGLCLSVLFHPAAARVAPPASEAPSLFFPVPQGQQINAFYRQGKVAAHIVLDSDPAPRLIVAFPAGNSGVGLWFDDQASDAVWDSIEKDEVEPVNRTAEGGGELHGVTAELSINNASSLTVKQSVLGSVRTLRNYEYEGEVPEAVIVEPKIDGSSVTWRRKRLDGAPGYWLSVEVLNGTLKGGDVLTFTKTGEGPLRLRITALSGDPPLTPILKNEILNQDAADDETARDALNALAFLSYEEKLLAGSWRFNTYFGRDTLMSLYLLMPVLQRGVVEAGLGSVLDRLNDNGEVAHEEEIGEFAVLRRKTKESAGGAMQACPDLRGTEGDPRTDPICDYKMIDDDFMLAPVVARYLLDTSEGRSGAKEFLNRTTRGDETYQDVLLRNFHFVLDQAAPFADRPEVKHMIALRSGNDAGEWRDSKNGLGYGRIPYNVNAALVPAALQAIGRLAKSRLLDVEGGQAARLAEAAWMAEVWTKAAPPFFTVTVESDKAEDAVRAYAKQARVDRDSALRSLPQEPEPLRFNAVSLHADGERVPVLNSDAGFALLLLDPPEEEVERSVEAMMRPFPAGLRTDVGLLVANPAFADYSLQSKFDNRKYHGTVIWSWQQAVLAAGLARQLQRKDLSSRTQNLLRDAQVQLWKAIKAGGEVQSSELWSWSFEKEDEKEERYCVEPFGQRRGHQTESNAAQLWSTVFLAVAPPHGLSGVPPAPRCRER